jgi:hypothetical protein
MVAMTLQESVHFSVNASSIIADLAWSTTTAGIFRSGHGFVRMGPRREAFLVSAIHQMHCLRVFQHELLGVKGDVILSDLPGHFRHCLNYLRQTILCAAAGSLETGDAMQRDWEVDRIAGSMVCENWESIFEEVDQNSEYWEEWRREWD